MHRARFTPPPPSSPSHLPGKLTTPIFFSRRCRNPAIEKWAKFKEDYHIRFQWTPQRVFDVLLWGFTVPFCVYKVFVYEQVGCKPLVAGPLPPFLPPCLARSVLTTVPSPLIPIADPGREAEWP